jgi:hypothetical protein
MTKIRGKPPIITLKLHEAEEGDRVKLDNGTFSDVVGVTLGHDGCPTISCRVSGYGTAQFYKSSGVHIFGKCPPIVALIKTGKMGLK